MEENTAVPQAMENVQGAGALQPEDTIPSGMPETVWDLKYNHEVVQKPTSEVLRLAQMGMNYDKVHSQLSDLKNDEALSIADKIAAQYGVSRTELLKKWENDLSQQAVSDYAAQNGLTTAVAKELLDVKRAAGELLGDKRNFEQMTRIDAEVEAFHAEFPDVADADVPDGVLDLWAAGLTLPDAYRAYEGGLTGNYAALKTNRENAASSMGSVQSYGSAAPFRVTEEWIKKASLKEYEAHRDEVKEWYFNRRRAK